MSVEVMRPADLLGHLEKMWTERSRLLQQHIPQAVLKEMTTYSTRPEPPISIGGSPGRVRLVTEATVNLRIARIWQQFGSTVYVMHGGMVEALLKSADKYLGLPARVLDRLPHLSPMFLFPEGVQVRLANGEPGVLRAMYVTGVVRDAGERGGTAVPTHAPERNSLTVLSVSEVTNTCREDTDLSLTSVLLPGPPRTIGQTVEQVAAEYQVAAGYGGGSPFGLDTVTDHVKAIVTLAAVVMTYVGAVNADVQRRPPTGKKRSGGRGKRGEREPNWMKVGYAVGPMIGGTRREGSATRGTGTGSPVAPHIRAAHPHLYWTGPGRTEPVIHMLGPVTVKGGGRGVPVLHDIADHNITTDTI